MIVEDSGVVRTLLTHIIGSDPRLTVAGSFATAEEAIAALPSLRPDVISMDIRLPGIDGLEATRRIMADHPTPIVVISASMDGGAMGTSMDALRAGALSVVEKPVGLGDAAYAQVAHEIRTQLAIMSEVAVVRRRMHAISPVPVQPPRQRGASMLLVAASTGGPPALARLFGALPADLPVPVLLVQHMGASFMSGFASWLDSVVPQRVEIARGGDTPAAGAIHVAPGNAHLVVARGGTLRIATDGPVGGQRPSATRLIESAAVALDGAALAVVLTGMGEDGAAGVRALLAAGGQAVAEDASTSVVYGMPAAAQRAGALSLPLDLIAPHVRRVLERQR
ncbi:MAG: chemotaxis response regulator protein-glutamate methylesterase [Sphingomonas hengshuiensis]|uniref:protein-glutamate methylesterase n=1 Tax=Sphingomonas hengshuiensis TaxID=1609977 RepID=A0A2W4ZEV0_9SPHN|nr:MAG: chemotaxis response regulator protein-glutamate methylesterase [Sphingomonas hengshuiensis]